MWLSILITLPKFTSVNRVPPWRCGVLSSDLVKTPTRAASIRRFSSQTIVSTLDENHATTQGAGRVKRNSEDGDECDSVPDLEDVHTHPSATQLSYKKLLPELKEVQAQYPNQVLLVDMGDMYGIFGDLPSPHNSYLEEVADLLRLSIYEEEVGEEEEGDVTTITMSEFPKTQLGEYIKMLVKDGRSVGIIHHIEFDEDQEGGYLPESLKRKAVVHTVTPGTTLNSSWINPLDNNFLLAVFVDESSDEYCELQGLISQVAQQQHEEQQGDDDHPQSRHRLMHRTRDLASRIKTGLAWADIGTGELFVSEVPLSKLKYEASRIQPKEILVSGTQEMTIHHVFDESLGPQIYEEVEETTEADDSEENASTSERTSSTALANSGATNDELYDQDETVPALRLKSFTFRGPSIFSPESTDQQFARLLLIHEPARALTTIMTATAKTPSDNIPSKRSAAASTSRRRSPKTSAPSLTASLDHAKVFEGFTALQIRAGGALLNYLVETFPNSQPVFREPIKFTSDQFMALDRVALRSLNVVSGVVSGRAAVTASMEQVLGKGSQYGSLLGIVNFTVSTPGTRLLVSRLKTPSTSIPEINRRLDLTECFLHDPFFREQLQTNLYECRDIERIIQRIHIVLGVTKGASKILFSKKGKKDPRAVLALSSNLANLGYIPHTDEMTSIKDLTAMIENAICIDLQNVVVTIKAVQKIKKDILGWLARYEQAFERGAKTVSSTTTTHLASTLGEASETQGDFNIDTSRVTRRHIEEMNKVVESLEPPGSDFGRIVTRCEVIIEALGGANNGASATTVLDDIFKSVNDPVAIPTIREEYPASSSQQPGSDAEITIKETTKKRRRKKGAKGKEEDVEASDGSNLSEAAPQVPESEVKLKKKRKKRAQVDAEASEIVKVGEDVGDVVVSSSQHGSGVKEKTEKTVDRYAWMANDPVLDALRKRRDALTKETEGLRLALRRKYGVPLNLISDDIQGGVLHVDEKSLGLLRHRTDSKTLTSRMIKKLSEEDIITVDQYMTNDPELRELKKRRDKKRGYKLYKHKEWTVLERKVRECEDNIQDMEMSIFRNSYNEITAQTLKLVQMAVAMSELDFSVSSALVADHRLYSRPIMVEENVHDIIGGRHPVVEVAQSLRSKEYVGNDCFIGGDQRLWLVTGPNMGGKSTFLRQCGLISIMAQTGLFVPATAARLGPVDRVLARVGSGDSLLANKSSFMLEMEETANILNNATEKSFVIMDEVGRGTSTYEGICIAYVVLRYLVEETRCRGLFATHFLEIVRRIHDPHCHPNPFQCVEDPELGSEKFESLAFCKMPHYFDENGGIKYLYKVEPGIADGSHGIEVARTAGLPDSVITWSRHFFEKYKHFQGDFAAFLRETEAPEDFGLFAEYLKDKEEFEAYLALR
ncbi:DNA mismatch repair ATPase msh1 [Quaeritorhiza haematococci]|nr:DNA mismatch repair ATPase msh1 [Quaeritorhiza haematococci]